MHSKKLLLLYGILGITQPFTHILTFQSFQPVLYCKEFTSLWVKLMRVLDSKLLFFLLSILSASFCWPRISSQQYMAYLVYITLYRYISPEPVLYCKECMNLWVKLMTMRVRDSKLLSLLPSILHHSVGQEIPSQEKYLALLKMRWR